MKFDFFHAIRRKSEIEPTSEFDKKFWSRFDAEFSPAPSFFEKVVSAFLRVPRMPAMAAALLTLIASYTFFANRSHMESTLTDDAVAFESLELVDDLDFAEGLEDDLLVLADDEDWEELLQEVVDET